MKGDLESESAHLKEIRRVHGVAHLFLGMWLSFLPMLGLYLVGEAIGSTQGFAVRATQDRDGYTALWGAVAADTIAGLWSTGALLLSVAVLYVVWRRWRRKEAVFGVIWAGGFWMFSGPLAMRNLAVTTGV